MIYMEKDDIPNGGFPPIVKHTGKIEHKKKEGRKYASVKTAVSVKSLIDSIKN